MGLKIQNFFGSRNDRVLKSMAPLVRDVNSLEEKYEALSDQEIREQTDIFRKRLKDGESLKDIQVETFAVVREAAKRSLGMRHFDVQLIGGAVLHAGSIAEMRTGEGKTLVATLPAYLNALEGKGVHVVTVNDYLAKRDAEWMGRVYEFLGLSVGVVYGGMTAEEKQKAYGADITYGENTEFGFDYLRDNMKFSLAEMAQREHFFAIVDEVDSILIDEARTPLVISGQAEDAAELYYAADKIIPKLKDEEDFEVDLKSKRPSLTDDGVAHIEKLLGIDNLYDPGNIDMLHHVNQALRAHKTMERDTDYIVQNGKVMIIDEFTGRIMDGRRWSDGLHQAVEAKENLQIARESQTLASITYKNYFHLYNKLSGMTGTADTEAPEFKEIYNLDVVVIPTNKPMARDDQSDMVYRTRKEKYEAVCEDLAEIHKTEQPVLVGTISIEQSEELSRFLDKNKIPHNVLNAKQHEREADFVAQAGRLGAITISTNMAGRGTDIKLGGNPEFLAADELGTKDLEDEEFQAVLQKYTQSCEEEKEKVIAAGGLFIMGTERHESRRIDNQLRGRSGRQGDPGTSRFYISLEDDLMKRFGGDKLQGVMARLGWEEGAALDGRIVSKTVERAQKRVEGMHFDARKGLNETDDVMNKQRQVVYNMRAQIMKGDETRSQVLEMIDDLLEDAVLNNCDEKTKDSEWKLDELEQRFEFLFSEKLSLPDDIDRDQQTIFDYVRDCARKLYEKQVELATSKFKQYEDLGIVSGEGYSYEGFEQSIMLPILDQFWNLQLRAMDDLQEGVRLRGYGQLNWKSEYQREGYVLFQSMLFGISESVIRNIFHYRVLEPEEYLAAQEEENRRREEFERQMKLNHEAEQEAAALRELKNPKTQKEKLAEQRRARRKRAR